MSLPLGQNGIRMLLDSEHIMRYRVFYHNSFEGEFPNLSRAVHLLQCHYDVVVEPDVWEFLSNTTINIDVCTFVGLCAAVLQDVPVLEARDLFMNICTRCKKLRQMHSFLSMTND